MHDKIMLGITLKTLLAVAEPVLVNQMYYDYSTHTLLALLDYNRTPPSLTKPTH